MNQMEFQREIAAYEEKIALAELEETKAAERVKELKYKKARFALDVMSAACKDGMTHVNTDNRRGGDAGPGAGQADPVH